MAITDLRISASVEAPARTFVGDEMKHLARDCYSLAAEQPLQETVTWRSPRTATMLPRGASPQFDIGPSVAA
jgi:hypothetical protein